MAEQPRDFECVVIGAGIAGAALAARLAEWGRRVALLASPPREDAGVEAIPASTHGLLARSGLMSSIRAHRFTPPRAEGLIWGDGRLRWREAKTEERGWVVERGPFLADARAIARSCGAVVFEGARADRPLPDEGHGEVAFEADGARRAVETACVVLAAGRSPRPDLVPLHLERQLPRSTMLVCELPLRAAPRIFRNAHVVEAVPEGWLRWLPRRDGLAALELHADADELKMTGPRTLFGKAVAHASGPAASFADWSDIEPREPGNATIFPGYGSPATARLVASPGAVLLCGDAASTVDPLASQGLEKALGSAERAAVAVNTILQHPGKRPAVVAAHRRFEAELWEAHARRSLAFHLDEPRFTDLPYWRARHAAIRVDIEPPARLDVLPPLLRASPRLVVRPALRREGRLYVDAEGFALADGGETLESVATVPIAPLLRALALRPAIAELIEAAPADPALRRAGQTPIIRALGELWRLGFLEAV